MVADYIGRDSLFDFPNFYEAKADAGGHLASAEAERLATGAEQGGLLFDFHILAQTPTTRPLMYASPMFRS